MRVLTAPFVRIVLLAGVAVAATVWAIWHFYTRGHPEMVVPVPSSTGSEEIPVPEVLVPEE